jgi:hypothetical protein
VTRLSPSGRQPSRFWLFAPFVLAALGAAAWTGLWFTVKTQAVAALDAWVGEARAAGREAGYTAVKAAGYPLRFELVVDGLRVADPGAGFWWSARSLSLHLLPYQPHHVIVQSRGPQTLRVRRGGAVWTIEATSLKASLRWTGQDLRRFSLHADDLVWRDVANRRGDISAFELHVAPTPGRTDLWRLWMTADGGVAPQVPPALAVFGREFSQVKVTGAVTRPDLLKTGLSPARLADWSSGGGALTIDRADGSWGRVRWSAVGQFTADADGAPQGRLRVTLHNLRAVADILTEAGWVGGPVAALTRAAADEAEQKQGGLSGDLVLRQGQILVAGAPLAAFSALGRAPAPPAATAGRAP